MKRLLMLLVIVGILIGAGGCISAEDGELESMVMFQPVFGDVPDRNIAGIHQDIRSYNSQMRRIKMEITVLKCDRCKQEVDGLIGFNFINRTVEPEEDKDNNNLLTTMFGKRREYPTIRGGLCFNCTEELLRWLGHPENSLNSRIKGVRL